MAKKLSKFLSSPIVLALAYIVIGVLFCIKKSEVLKWVVLIAGILFIVQGVIDIIFNKNFTTGIIEAAIGVVIILFGMLLLQAAAIILGVVMIINGVIAIVTLPKSLAVTIYNLLAIVIGVLLIVGYWYVVDWFYILIGVALIVNGVLTLFGKRF